jgi:LemA protein
MTISMASIRSFTFAVMAGLTLAGCGYNTIPTLEEQAKAKWGDVQNNYQRRADLIPNLVSTVQGYAKQERDVLTSVIEAVRAYNTELRTFPGIIWASTFFRGNKPMAEFTAGEGADKPPPVKF